MCNPAIFMAAAAGVKVMGQIQQGRDAKDLANAQAAQDDLAGATARSDALAQAQMIRKAQTTAVGASDAAAAAAGIRVGVGSAAEDDRTILQNSEHDAHMAILNGERKSDSYAVQAALTRQGGANANRNAQAGAVGTVLQTFGSMGGSGWATGGGGGFGGQG